MIGITCKYSNVFSGDILINRTLEFVNIEFGVFSVMEPHWTISNSIVKHYCGENTGEETFWENNSMPSKIKCSC